MSARRACAELLAVLRGALSEQGGQQIVVRKLTQGRKFETGHGFLPLIDAETKRLTFALDLT